MSVRDSDEVYILIISKNEKQEEMMHCEESSCEHFQSTICLHCMHRLCNYHMEVHHQILVHKLDELNTEVNEVTILLSNTSNALMEQRTIEENKCIHWRTEKIAEIEREYNRMINPIRDRQHVLEELEMKLNQRLKMEVQQPLEHMLTQKSVNPSLLDTIQLAAETIKTDCQSLVWKFEPTNIAQESKMDEQIKQNIKSSKGKKVKAWQPRNYMFALFRDVGPTSVTKITEYVQTEMKDQNALEQYGLITLIFSYLRTWHQTKADRGRHKQLILTKHIITVKQYITGRDDQRKAFIALQFFYNTLKLEASQTIEMMTMLLQLFFKHQCISISEMIDWYVNESFVEEILQKKVEKQWAEPFLTLHDYRIESTDSSSTNGTSTTAQSHANQLTREHVHIRKPIKSLVKLFKDPTNINDHAIHQYVQKRYKEKIVDRVIMIIRCYLKVWNDSSLDTKMDYLLNKLSLIQYYQSNDNFQMEILFAVEVFLYENKNDEKWSIDTVSILLQFFLEQKCLNMETIRKWYSSGHSYQELYYEETKCFAQSFIEQLLNSDKA